MQLSDVDANESMSHAFSDGFLQKCIFSGQNASFLFKMQLFLQNEMMMIALASWAARMPMDGIGCSVLDLVTDFGTESFFCA